MRCSSSPTTGLFVALAIAFGVALSGCGPDNLIQGLSNPFGYGLCGLIVVVLDVIALVEIINSPRSTGDKLLWSLIIVFLPFVGLIAYYMFGKK